MTLDQLLDLENKMLAVADLRGREGRAPPSGSKFLNFHAVFGTPPLGNPGFTVNLVIKSFINKLLPIKIQEALSKDSIHKSLIKHHSHNTRGNLSLPKTSCKSYKRSFLYASTLTINTVPAVTRMKQTLSQFVKSCKNSLTYD